MNGQQPPTLPPPTPPADVRYVTAEQLAAAVAQAHSRIEDLDLAHKRRVGELERDHYKLAGERYSRLEGKVDQVLDAAGDARREVQTVNTRIEALFAHFKIPLPEVSP